MSHSLVTWKDTYQPRATEKRAGKPSEGMEIEVVYYGIYEIRQKLTLIGLGFRMFKGISTYTYDAKYQGQNTLQATN